jgi:uncharacterized membrane protein
MPYEWSATARTHLRLWPHRSLAPEGFVWFIGATAVLLGVPLLGLFGTPVLWTLLPFLLAALGAIWFAIRRNQHDRAITEELRISNDQVTLERHGPRGAHATWAANPHWVRVTLHAIAGPVPQYLTLTGAGREVEIGAFLTEAERIALQAELQTALMEIRHS